MEVTRSAPTWWLSFADDEFLGAVLVDGVDDFLSARLAASMAGVNPSGQCTGFPIEEIPDEYAEAFAALPRLQLLSIEQLRVLGPLVNTDGEPR